jgi:hypothetical protein
VSVELLEPVTAEDDPDHGRRQPDDLDDFSVHGSSAPRSGRLVLRWRVMIG